ncbi:MAG: NAD(P)H dehydrogenase assembly family protein [Cyanobium sp.]
MASSSGPAPTPPNGSPADPDAPLSPPTLAVGDPVVVVGSLRYLKTAEPMPMLRPPDLVDAGEVGHVVERRAGEVVAVRFRRGTFLLVASQLRPAGPPGR